MRGIASLRFKAPSPTTPPTTAGCSVHLTLLCWHCRTVSHFRWRGAPNVAARDGLRIRRYNVRMIHDQSSNLHVAWKSGSGNRWSVGLRGRAGEEIVIRATNSEQADAAARAVLWEDESLQALRLAYSAMFVHGECGGCSRAVEVVGAALAAHDKAVVSASDQVAVR
jgi:hypothetical protein